MAQALFFTYFDDHKGQSLLWSRTKGSQNLEGIELQALPSGLHLVERDTYCFRRIEPKSPTGSQVADDDSSYLGTVVFRNRPLSQEEIEAAGGEGKTRGRLMIGLGTLMPIHNAAIPFGSSATLERAIDTISRDWRVDQSPEERDSWLSDILLPLWGSLEQNAGKIVQPGDDLSSRRQERRGDQGIPAGLGLSSDNPLKSFMLFGKTLGVPLLTLWKYAVAGRRILFYGIPPLSSICQAAYLTWLMSLRITELHKQPQSTYLGMIGLADLSLVAGIPHGWVACTSDAIYKDKLGIYDLLVDCSGSDILPSTPSDHHRTNREPVMRAVLRDKGQVSLKYLSYTYSDSMLWNTIAPLLLQTASSDLGSAAATGSLTGSPTNAIWSTAVGTYTYICDICWGLCALATGTGYAPHPGHHDDNSAGYIRLPTEENEDRESSDNEEYLEDEDNIDVESSAVDKPNDSMAKSAIQILKILDHRREHIEMRLARVVSDTGTSILSKEDMRRMGLSAWSWVDVEFVRSLYRLRKSQPISIGTFGNSLLVEKGWIRRAIGLVGL